jgi:hypothetical protein
VDSALSCNSLSVTDSVSCNSLSVSDNGSFGGTLTVTDALSCNSLSVSDNGSFGGTLNVSGDASLNGILLVGGDATFNGILLVGGDASFNKNLTVSGKVTAGSFNSTSDYRLKENIREFSLNEYSVDHLRPVEYNFKTHSSENKSIGFIAHEVQEHLPSLVNGERDGEEMQSIKQLEMTSLLVKEIQELKKRLNKIENQLI